MKKWLLSLVALSVMLYCPVAYADEDDQVEPNIYEKIKIDIQQNFRDNLEHKEELTEEQQSLTFEKPDKTNSNRMQEKLFQSSKQEPNTTKTKASQLGLFSELDQQAKRKTTDDEPNQHSSKVMLLLLVAIVIVITAMFVLVIPKLGANETS